MTERFLYVGKGILVVGFISYFGYSYWTSTPEYALQQIVKAVETHDTELFHKYVDVTTIAERIIEGLADSIKDKPDTSSGSVGESPAKGRITLVEPRLAEIVREQVERYVERGDVPQAGTSDPNEESFSLKRIQDRIGRQFRDVKYVRGEGKIATVGIGLHNERLKIDQVLELRLTFPQFRGHRVKPQPSSLHTRLGSHSRGSSAGASDYRTPQCTRRYPVSRLHGWRSADGTRVHA